MRRWALVVMALALASALAATAQKARPPKQPALGPGGKAYAHRRVSRTAHGQGATSYWLFEPGSPAPKTAPVVIFLHGWSAMNPVIYGAWIDHIVRRGNIVIYPRYQADLRTPPAEFTPNTIAAVKAALHELQTRRHVKPDREKVAVVGHSVGGLLAANLAALAAESELPRPRAVMCVQPGKSWGRIKAAIVPVSDLGKVPRETLLLALAGDRDTICGDRDAKRIYNETKQVPAENKDYVLMVSDEHGGPALVADHFAPIAISRAYDSGERPPDARQGMFFVKSRTGGETLNALDYYGTWKLLDALCEAAFEGKNRDAALGNTDAQRDMGEWSDGAAVKELSVTDKP